MHTSRLLKYKIGLLVIGVFTVAMFILVLAQAGATKQDAQTDKLANTVADKLNGYTSGHSGAPESLRQAGVTGSLSGIGYNKLSDSKYRFCVTYKAASSSFDPSSAALDLASGGSPADLSAPVSTDGYLIVPTSHHKGANCQIITLAASNSSNCNSPYGLCMQNFNSSASSGSASDTSGQVAAADSQRETDIDELDAQLEAYYANNGYYPTLADLNNASWRSANMQALDASSLCDPSSQSTANCELASDTRKGVYSYRPTDANNQTCTTRQSCTGFELTAMLSTGERFTKQSSV